VELGSSKRNAMKKEQIMLEDGRINERKKRKNSRNNNNNSNNNRYC